MKQVVQLFIDNEQVDVFESGSINIQSSIKDLRDPGKVFTDFSRDFRGQAVSVQLDEVLRILKKKS